MIDEFKRIFSAEAGGAHVLAKGTQHPTMTELSAITWWFGQGRHAGQE